MESSRSEGEKYIYLGVLLKKDRPAALNSRILEIIEQLESVDRKIEMILELDETRRKRTSLKPVSKIEKPPKRVPRVKPLVVLVDPQEELFRFLKSTLLRTEITLQRWNTVEDRGNEMRDAALFVINGSSYQGGYPAELLRLVRRNASTILLSEALDAVNGEKGLPFRILKKPLHMTELENTIREMIVTEPF